jgi:hypothetical protein
MILGGGGRARRTEVVRAYKRALRACTRAERKVAGKRAGRIPGRRPGTMAYGQEKKAKRRARRAL